MVSCRRNTCLKKNDLWKNDDEFDLKMTLKCTQKRPEARARTKKSTAEKTTKRERKKTPKLDAATHLKPVNLV